MYRLIDTVILDSKDRASYSSSTSDFKIRFPSSNEDVDQIVFKSVTFPFTLNNVTSTTNTYYINGDTNTIPVGLYTVTTLMAAMNVQLAPHNIVMTLSHGFRFVLTHAIGMVFRPMTMTRILGFTATEYTGAIETGENAPNILCSNYFTLHSQYFSDRQQHPIRHTDNRSSTILYMPISDETDIGGIFYYEPEKNSVNYVSHMHQTDMIDIVLRNDQGTIVDLQGQHLVVAFERYRNM